MKNWLSEPYVVELMRNALQSYGYKLHAERPMTAHGADIVGRHPRDRHYIFVECKGYPTGDSEGAQRDNYFLAVLGQILLRMRQENAYYAIALPDHPFYTKRILRAEMRRARRWLGLWFFLVGRGGVVRRLTASGTAFQPYFPHQA
jgi:hypothetical protein